MNEFNEIIIKTRCKVKLIHGDKSSFINCEIGEKANWINMSIVNNKLVLYTKPEYYGYLLLHDYYPQITITYKTLTALQMLDRCFVKSVETLPLERMGIIVKYGKLDMLVDALIIDCTVLKRAYVKLSGQTMISYVLALQEGIYDGAELKASEGNVDANDESEVSVWFTTKVKIRLTSRSKLHYRGSPSFRINQIDDFCTINKISTSKNTTDYEPSEVR